MCALLLCVSSFRDYLRYTQPSYVNEILIAALFSIIRNGNNSNTYSRGLVF